MNPHFLLKNLRRYFVGLLVCLSSVAQAAPDLRDGGNGHHIISTIALQGGDLFSFQFEIENRGSSSADSRTKVEFWLSSDATLGNAGDIKIHSADIGEVPVGTGNKASATITAPVTGAVGTWNLMWELIASDEADPRDNTALFSKKLTITAPPAFDLADAGAAFRSLSPATLTAGQSFQAGTRVTNLGPTAAPGFNLTWRLSTDTIIGDADDVKLGTSSWTGLDAPGTSHAVTQHVFLKELSIPQDTAPGTYRFGYTITAPTDTNQTNNKVLFSQSIIVSAPPTGTVDLVDAGSGFWQGPFFPSVVSGNTFTVGGAIRNIGNVPSVNSTLRFFVSANAIGGDGDDIILPGSYPVGPVLPNSDFSQLQFFSEQVPSGLLQIGTNYRVGWIITGGNDANNANNLTLSNILVFTLPQPEIQIANDWTISGVLNDGGSIIEVGGSLLNNTASERNIVLELVLQEINGNGSVDETEYSNHNAYFLDDDLVRFVLQGNGSTSAVLRETSSTIQRLRAVQGGRHVITESIRRKVGSTFRVTLKVYQDLNSAARFNFNLGSLLTSRILGNLTVQESTRPDLSVNRAFINQSAVAPGGILEIVGIWIDNVGSVDAPPSQLRLLANGNPFGPVITVPAIPRNSLYELGSRSVTIPSGQPLGDTTISIRVDSGNTIVEDNELNDFTVDSVLIGFLPDLRDAGPGSRTMPDALLPGVQSLLGIRVTNAGLGNAGLFEVSFYFTPDSIFDEGTALYLGTMEVGALNFLSSVDLNFPFALPVGTPAGSGYLFWKIDESRRVNESVETNNIYSHGPVLIDTRANLRPGGTPFSNTPQQIGIGQNRTLLGSIINAGNTPSGPFKVAFVLWQNGEQGRTTVPFTSLEGGEEILFSVVPEPAAPPLGLYQIGMYIDAWGNVEETSESDNIVWLTDLLEVIEPAGPPTPVIFDFEKLRDDVRIDWLSAKGFNYRMEASINGTTWRNFGNLLPGEPGQMSQWFLDVATEPSMIFRIRQE